MKTHWITFLLAVASFGASASATAAEIEFAFDRIIHGWTNYSTAFNATHSLDASGEFATIATAYRPGCDIILDEYRVIVVWAGPLGQEVKFSNFDFQFFIWSGLQAFTNAPLQGDVASAWFAAPSGSSVDAITRAGRPAYELRFPLRPLNLRLEHNHTYLVGFSAGNHANGYADLFVPTSSHSGQSDLQAGNILVQGWIELVNAGGATVYSGQLATALVVAPMLEPPKLNIEITNGLLNLTWAASAGCFRLESTVWPSEWATVNEPAVLESNIWKVVVRETSLSSRLFRLSHEVP